MKRGQEQVLPSNRQIKCDVCQVWCSGNISYKDHVSGRPHFVALQKQKGEDFQAPVSGNGTKDDGPPAKKARQSFEGLPEEMQCDVCDISVINREAYDAHMQGARHLRRVKETELATNVDKHPHIVEIPGRGYRCELCLVEMSSKVVVLSHINGSKHYKKLKTPVPTAPPASCGEKTAKPILQFECKICHIFTNTAAVLQVHEASAKHRHRASLAAKIAAEVDAQQKDHDLAQAEANLGVAHDAWDPSNG